MKSAKEMHTLATSKKGEKFTQLLKSIEQQAAIGNYRMVSEGLLTGDEIDILTKAGYRVEIMNPATCHMVYWDKITI